MPFLIHCDCLLSNLAGAGEPWLPRYAKSSLRKAARS